ncbi:MAG TPA: AAA family ATPase [Actinophytocola sp.]
MTERPPITAADRLARDLRVEIEARRLPHGTRLPSTKVMAERHGASATTVSRAVQQLVDEGLVIAVARTGRVVNFPAPEEPKTPDRLVVVLIGGYAGSGKTELGRVLARLTRWAMIDKDSITRAVVEAALSTIGLSPHDRESPQYRNVVRPAEYEALLMTTEENIECGTSCIVTAPHVSEFADPAWCKRTRSALASRGAKVQFVWVSCDPETMHRYIRKRGAARDAAKLADWDAWIGSLDLNLRPATEHLIIDNSAGAPPLQEQAEALLAAVMQ